MSVSNTIKNITAIGTGYIIGVALAWLVNALGMLLAGLIGKTATICLLGVISFALGFFGMRAYINKRSAKPVRAYINKRSAKPVLLLTK